MLVPDGELQEAQGPLDVVGTGDGGAGSSSEEISV